MSTLCLYRDRVWSLCVAGLALCDACLCFHQLSILLPWIRNLPPPFSTARLSTFTPTAVDTGSSASRFLNGAVVNFQSCCHEH